MGYTVRPSNWVFDECTRGLASSLKRLAKTVKVPDIDIAIVFFSFAGKVPENGVPYIAFECEQLERSSKDTTFIAKMKGALCIWTPFHLNVKYWKEVHGLNAIYVPLYYAISPTLLALPFCPDRLKDVDGSNQIDALMFGYMNPRRAKAERMFAPLRTNFGFFVGPQLQNRIKRCKSIVNVKFYPKGELEVHRINSLLAQGILVFSEASLTGSKLDALYKDIVPMASYDELPNLVRTWLSKDDDELVAHRKKGYDFIRALNQDLDALERANQFTVKCIAAKASNESDTIET